MRTLDELKAIAEASNGPPRGNVVQFKKCEPEKTEISLSDHANALEEMRERENLGLKLQLYGSLLVASKDRAGLKLLRKQALGIVDDIDAYFRKEAGL